MSLRNVRVLVTGGAGFIGSHLVDALMKSDAYVTVLDNLSSGFKANIERWEKFQSFRFVQGDCLQPRDVAEAIGRNELVFHLAANAEVRRGSEDTRVDLEQNLLATYTLLEAMRRSGGCKRIAFTSTSTVYGEATRLPTPEDYGPLLPTSLYGASKLACEALISAYVRMFGLNAIIYRLANVVGARSRRGVIWDFTRKLHQNPERLEILGDGRQAKSYLLVDDCIEAMLLALREAKEPLEVYNVGSEDQVSVNAIAHTVATLMGAGDVTFEYVSVAEGGRGWVGDVKMMLLDVSKLKRLGWSPRHNSLESVRIAAKQALLELERGTQP
ncbi:MAG: NAD-dependent epimerase/dehydratase family protein [Candidatus Bathyarchaeia archaeon]